jgi:hypothetical protein
MDNLEFEFEGCKFYNISKVWWDAATLFIYFYINRADIQCFYIYYSYRAPLLLSSLLSARWEGLLWGAEPRFEPGRATI